MSRLILSNEFYSNPFGFLFCQFQLSRIISLIPYSARQPSSRSAFAPFPVPRLYVTRPVVLDRLKSVHVASSEVNDVDVVPDAGAIQCVIVIPENMQLLQLSRCTQSNTRPLISLAIYRNQSLGVVKK